MKRTRTILIVLVCIVVVCGCNRSVSVPMPYETVVAQIRTQLGKPDSGIFSEWHKHELVNTPTVPPCSVLRMSCGWTRSSRFRYEKMVDKAVISLSPEGDSETRIQISVRSHNALVPIGDGERNRRSERRLGHQLAELLSSRVGAEHVGGANSGSAAAAPE